jgi:hypothetical protein
MASVTKSVSGNTTTFTIVDSANVSGTIAVTQGVVTGPTTTISATAVHTDWLQMAVNLLEQLQTGVVPGAGAQNLVP